jgi:hypothetical protein
MHEGLQWRGFLLEPVPGQLQQLRGAESLTDEPPAKRQRSQKPRISRFE